MRTLDCVSITDFNPPDALKPGKRFIRRLAQHPVYYQQITKCGCTFVKNLFYLIDDPRRAPQGDGIHRIDDQILRAGDVADEEILASPLRFIIIRDPVSRFLSLYFDKICPANGKNADHFAFLFRDEAGVNLQAETLIEHQSNISKSLNYINKSVNMQLGEPPNWHWRPQLYRVAQIAHLDFLMIPLEEMQATLSTLLRPHVPQIDEQIARITQRNTSRANIKKADLTNDAIAEQIADIYPRDTAMYHEVKRHWRGIDAT